LHRPDVKARKLADNRYGGSTILVPSPTKKALTHGRSPIQRVLPSPGMLMFSLLVLSRRMGAGGFRWIAPLSKHVCHGANQLADLPDLKLSTAGIVNAIVAQDDGKIIVVAFTMPSTTCRE